MRSLSPHNIIAGFVAGVMRRTDWRRIPNTPSSPDNDASRLLALLHHGGYTEVPRQPTERMLRARDPNDAKIWLEMILAWEDELEEMKRPIDFTEFVNGINVKRHPASRTSLSGS